MIDTLSTPELAYCIVVLLFTFALRGSLGFGGAVGLPLLALVIPVKVLAPAWSLVGIVSSVAIVGRDRQHVDRRAFLRLLPGCALGIAAGLFLFKSLDAVLLARTLGAFIIVYAIYSLWMTTRPADSTPLVPPALLRPFASFFSGAVGTLFGAMASIFFAMYLDASGANKQTFRATLSAMLLTLSLARTVGYAAVHELTLDSFILCAAAIPAMGIGLLLGDKIHSGLSQAAFQRVVCAALFLCGIPLLMR
ncbi:MAG TPA: sulfite exporter TauE/SafE family protein [Burkholderiales bacterium]|nr:sulfite exporter TauE/SafE family protein [Burkholderiales bacterium]